MKPVPARKYRDSEKRKITKEQNRAAIQKAAWEVFCTIGIDAANVRDIVNRSGLSPGTFYNYYRTKEAIFEALSQGLLNQLRADTRASRAKATNLEELLFRCYDSYLRFVESIEGSLDFIARNQHHIRSQLYPSSAISGLLQDLADDLRRFVPGMSKRDRAHISSLIIAVGAEAIFRLNREPIASMKYLRDFLPKFMLHGLTGWNASATAKPSA
jgi:AcrR family transcriptional regulator